MSKVRVIDTFPEFLAYWDEVQAEPIDAQIERWAAEYMAPWPELLAKQQENYAEEGTDWREVARERVFPFLAERMPAMETAQRNLQRALGDVYGRAQDALGFSSDIILVIYVGIGCGAGWVTRYEDTPAILFGLENVAECGWSEPPALTGLVAHEMGHLVHFGWREERGLADGEGPWWQLYTEGFAQRCEHRILDEETWHMASASPGWLDWCRSERVWLAAEFLRRVDASESMRPFFGSWYDLRGWKQCGYFLGHEVIRALEAHLSLREIALLEVGEGRVRAAVERLAYEEKKSG